MTKYEAYKSMAKDGDIILTHSNKGIAKAIQIIDTAYYHHCEIVSTFNGDLVGIGSHPNESRIDFLSDRFVKKKWDDFMIMRPLFNQDRISSAIREVTKRANEYSKYDMKMIFRVFFYEMFGVDIMKLSSSKQDICSELVQFYLIYLGDFNYLPSTLDRPFITPQDILRKADKNSYEFLYF